MRRVKFIRKKEFVVLALDSKYDGFVVHIAAFNINSDDKVHPSRRTQITNLKIDKALFKVPSKYADFVDVFSPKLATKLPKHTRINNHTIELVDN